MDYQAHSRIVLKSGTVIPRCIYGTAEKTDPNTIYEALNCGFRGFDTACQPQYYREEIVGQALTRAFLPEAEGGLGLDRKDLYIQTKFTTPAGQEPKTSPYKLDDTLATKVQKSLQLSLSNLGLTWVDTLLLHGPMPSIGETIEVWKLMETYVPDQAHNIGLSNVSLEQVEAVCEKAKIRPAAIQNRFRPQNNYDRDLRAFCDANDVCYQAFAILPSNARLLRTNIVGWLAEIASVTKEETLLNLVLSIGDSAHGSLCILNGTSSAQRMHSELATFERLGKVPAFIMQGFEEELYGSSSGGGN